MAINKTEHIKGVNAEWDAPVFEVEYDGTDFEVIGWNGIDENNPDNEKAPWQIYGAETKEGEIKYLAIPNNVAESLQLDEERVTSKHIWRKFLNYGDDWSRVAPFIPEVRTSIINLIEEIKEIKVSGKTIKLGKHCLDLGEQVFGIGPRSAIGPVLYSYDDFLARVVDTVRDEATCYINIQNGDIYKEKDNPGLRPSSYKLEFNNLRIDMIDVQKEWTKPYDSQKIIKSSITHSLRGEVVLSYYEQGVWKPIKTNTDMKLADLPAINEGNGLFKKSGSLYAIPCETFGNGKKLKTPGMKLYEALQVGIFDFCHSLGKQMLGFNFTSSYATERVLKGLDMNSGFNELFRSAQSGVRDEEENNEIYYERVVEQELEEEDDEEKEENDNEKKTDNSSVEQGKTVKYKIAGKPYFRLKGSAMYATDNNPIPRDALTVKISPSEGYVVGKNDEFYTTKADENNPTLLSCYYLDPSSSPEGKNGPLRGRLISHLRIGFDGTIYKPVVKPSQLKNLEEITSETIRWMQVFSTSGDVNQKCLEDYYYVRAGEVSEDGSFMLNEKGHVMAQKGANTYLVNPDEDIYVAIDPKCDHTAGTDIAGIPGMSKENRTQIKNSQGKAATNTIEAQAPSLTGNRDAAIGQDLIYRAEDDGVIEKIEYGKSPTLEEVPVTMTVKYDSGERETIDLRAQAKNNSKNLREQRPSYGIIEGARIEKGQPLTDVNGVCQGEPVLGSSCIIAIGGGTAENGTDDCIMISSRLARLLGHYSTETQEDEVVTNESASGYGPYFTFNPIIGKDSKYYGGYDCSKLGPDGVIKEGETVNGGDLIAWVMVPNGKVRRSMGEQLAMQHPKEGEPFTPPEDYKAVPVFAKTKIVNAKVSVSEISSGDGRKKRVFNYASYIPLENGSKISIDGMKGVVKVMPEETEPKIMDQRSRLDGQPVDIFISGNSAQNRQSVGIILLMLTNRLAYELGTVLDIGTDSRDILTDMENLARGNGYGDMTSNIVYRGKVINSLVGIAQNVMNVDKDVLTIRNTMAKTLSFMGITTGKADDLENTMKELREKSKKPGTITDTKNSAYYNATGYGIEVRLDEKNNNQSVPGRPWKVTNRAFVRVK